MRDNWIFAGIIGFAVALIAAMLWLAYLSGTEWEAFKTEHHCVIVSQTASTVISTIDSKGRIGFGTLSGQTGWKCDDGITYFR